MMADEKKKKGDFLENLVHDLHELAGDQVERDVQMLAIDDSGRTRQIDVLLSVAGEEFGDCPVRFPIECKNYGRKIGIQEIDSFVGKLNDIGIPPQFGIFVAVLSYTSDAMKRAKADAGPAGAGNPGGAAWRGVLGWRMDHEQRFPLPTVKRGFKF